MRAEAFAKVNVGLQVRPPGPGGLHPLRSLAVSIDWPDRVSVAFADEDGFVVVGDGVPADESNLAWRGLEAARRAAVRPRPLSLELVKSIPVAAGLGGGSADAAAALALTARLLGVPDGRRTDLAAGLGADVPFCLSGGVMWMEGTGDRLTPAPPIGDGALAVVVPPFHLATAEVYRHWDRMDGPEGPEVAGRSLPVSLRDLGPVRNDLQPAAVALMPALGDWIADVARRWGTPVMMSGSGPSLLGWFPSLGEATDAATSVPGVRAARGCLPAAAGWRLLAES